MKEQGTNPPISRDNLETFHSASVARIIGDGIDAQCVEAIGRRPQLGREAKRGLRLDKTEISKIEIAWRRQRATYH